MMRPALIPLITSVVGLAGLLILLVTLEDETSRRDRTLHGIPHCPPGADRNLLAPAALECWLEGSSGPWRTTSRVWVHGSLIVEASAASLVDAQAIARLFVENVGERFVEIGVYVNVDRGMPTSITRRVRWTRATGYETLDF